MIFEEFKKTVTEAFASNGLAFRLNDEKLNKLYRLSNLIVETNKVVNLTAITDEKSIILKHFIDCATICEHIEPNVSVIDVGCGAGFPTLPLAIFREDLSITALDSTGKKINFVEKVCDELDIINVKAVCSRAEEYVSENREVYDICTSRAVARLNVLSELCLPFIKTGGKFIAMKAGKGSEEHSEAERGIGVLGGSFIGSYAYQLSLDEEKIEREIYIYRKTSNTPTNYPRKYAQILKKPL